MTRDLCIMACVFCRDPAFQHWAASLYNAEQEFMYGSAANKLKPEAAAKAFILTTCQISSRNELDTNPEAAQRFHDHIRKPYLTWREEQ